MMKSRHLVWASGAVLGSVLLLSAAPCRADEAADRAAAEALYELGQKLLREGNYAEACAKLDASNSLDPGVGTSLLLGDCEEKAGKLASSWASFKGAAALARAHHDPERASIADTRAAALRPRLTYLVFRVSSADRMSGFELRRAGSLIAAGSWGIPLPTDAGRYQITASAPEHESWSATVEVPVKLDEPLVVDVPALKATRALPGAPGPRSFAPTAPPRLPSEPRDEEPSSGSTQRLLGIVSFGVGAAAGIVSGALTYVAAKKNHDSKNECRAGDVSLCTPAGVDARHSAKSLANVATVLGLGGGALALTGVTLFLTAPSGADHQTTGLVVGMSGGF